jgi:hypothetical protein
MSVRREVSAKMDDQYPLLVDLYAAILDEKNPVGIDKARQANNVARTQIANQRLKLDEARHILKAGKSA